MKGYSTKYALTLGIQEVEIHAPKDGFTDVYRYTIVPGHPNAAGTQLKVGVNFFTTPNDAEEAAKAMAKKKVIALRKQISKIRPLMVKPRWGKPT